MCVLCAGVASILAYYFKHLVEAHILKLKDRLGPMESRRKVLLRTMPCKKPW